MDCLVWRLNNTIIEQSFSIGRNVFSHRGSDFVLPALLSAELWGLTPPRLKYPELSKAKGTGTTVLKPLSLSRWSSGN
jgi:hypothetical protein